VFYDEQAASGLNQINFLCAVWNQRRVQDFDRRAVKGGPQRHQISVAPAGQTTCGDAHGSLTAANLQKAITNGSLNMGGVELSRVSGGNDTPDRIFRETTR